jgi:hypothetical protein
MVPGTLYEHSNDPTKYGFLRPQNAIVWLTGQVVDIIKTFNASRSQFGKIFT